MRWLEKEVRKTFQIKSECLEPQDSDLQEAWILNRVIRYTPHDLEYEADPRHGEIIIDELGLSAAKGLSTPGSRGIPHEEGEEE